MSCLEMTASVGQWQAAITRLSLQLQLDLTHEPESMLGFVSHAASTTRSQA